MYFSYFYITDHGQSINSKMNVWLCLLFLSHFTSLKALKWPPKLLKMNSGPVIPRPIKSSASSQHTFFLIVFTLPTFSCALATLATAVFSRGAECPPTPMCFPWLGQVLLTYFLSLLLPFCIFLVKSHLNWMTLLDSLFKSTTCTPILCPLSSALFSPYLLFISLICVPSPSLSPI